MTSNGVYHNIELNSSSNGLTSNDDDHICNDVENLKIDEQSVKTPTTQIDSPLKSLQNTTSGSSNISRTKRDDYLSWDEYFMSVALLSAHRSKDPNRQVGACVVNHDNKIVGIGYNGMPQGCSDDKYPWGKPGPGVDWLDTKYPYVCHAELNAIVNKNCADLKSCRIYVSLFPCNECTKLIIQSGIKEVIFVSDSYHDQKTVTASRRMLTSAKVLVRKLITSRSKVTLDFTDMKTSNSSLKFL